MPGHSDSMEKRILDWLFKQTVASAPPTNLYISLHSADPGDTAATAAANEISGGGYARANYATDINNSTNTQWTAVTTTNPPYSRMTNVLPVNTFVEATANWNSGNAITHFGVWSAVTAGEFLFGGQIGGGTGVVVLSGVTLSIPAGNIYHEVD